MPQSPEQNPDQPQEVEAVSIVLVEAPTDVAVVETPTDVGVVETSDSAPTAAASPKPLDLDPAFCAALAFSSK